MYILGFHEEVESSRNAAQEALAKDKVQIEKDIADATDQITKAEIALSGVVNNAENAKATAMEAQSQAQNANKVGSLLCIKLSVPSILYSYC